MLTRNKEKVHSHTFIRKMNMWNFPRKKWKTMNQLFLLAFVKSRNPTSWIKNGINIQRIVIKICSRDCLMKIQKHSANIPRENPLSQIHRCQKSIYNMILLFKYIHKYSYTCWHENQRMLRYTQKVNSRNIWK